MKQPLSQDLKKLEAQHQESAILQSQIQAANQEWQSQKKQIASDREVTITETKLAIVAATKDAKAELAKIEAATVAARDLHKIEAAAIVADSTELQERVTDLSRGLKVLTETNHALTDENRGLTSQIVVNTTTISEQEEVILKATDRISELDQRQTELRTENTRLIETIDVQEAQLSDLNDTFKDSEAKYSDHISRLELKKHALEQEIIQNRSQDDKVRENLADWAKKLDEKEKNLRIREAQNTEKEKSIARNYQLLQL